jgi:hypothetical protein
MPVPSRAGAFREPNSRGPCRGFYTPGQRSETRAAETPDPPSADPQMSAEGMRTALLSPAGATALLQRRMPAGGAAMVAVEGPAELPGDGGGQRKTQRAKPALSRARQKAARTSAAGSREGNHQRFFSITVATGLAAMKDSHTWGDRSCGASVHARAGAPWNVSGNGSGAGGGCAARLTAAPIPERKIIPTY